MIDRQEVVLAGEPCAEVAVATDPGVVRLRHEGDEGGGHGRIDCVATALEGREPSLYRERMPR